MNIYEITHRDHLKIKEIFEEILIGLKHNHWDVVNDLYRSLKCEIIIHAKAEEYTFHDLLVGEDNGTEPINWEFKEDHHVILLIMSQLSTVRMSDDEWKIRFKHLYEIVVDNINNEESIIFYAAKQKFSDQEAELIGLNMLEFKKKIKDRAEQLLLDEQHVFTLLIIQK